MTTHIPSLTLPSILFEQPAAAILLPIAAGTAVGFSLSPKETQKTYMALRQPPLKPPPKIFGPVWTVLYGLMGYGAYRAWTIGTRSIDPQKSVLAKHGATLYTLQLGLNLIWTPLFFGFKRPIEASADIIALTGTVGYLAYIWAQIDEAAAWCLAPYLVWLGFANYLCHGAGYLNNWDFSGKQQAKPGNKDTTFVDEKPKSS
ncbi:hypothetical protein AC578_418 [Pseudocercospora eumusae]|uniref:TspO/MBR-related protein n=1 Tax=Pseudocercospora eumusae TaxID=321146 RepID=A0A139HYG6_9PEZI|nr:hypothetical protein AC578_418 [Pseudocercospora eumusae]KXT07410.1 hypothetical protein AC578_418 [Pseudocercospora eumusae]KXT07411.1 hypothetical protein AC578_418 [Pseudocercospora eumusae]KXT07412.1 hypothetical protein AC578_418 [Pseudocercospora eumusae]